MTSFHQDILQLDCENEAQRICEFIQTQARLIRREGAVVGLSGGIDSALISELCVRALGKERVFGLVLPERESNPVSREYGLKQAQKLGIRVETVEITPVLEALGTYEKRDGIVKGIFPDLDDSFKMRIMLPPDILSKDAFNVFTLSVMDKTGVERSERLNKDALNGIVAATNTKQRIRMVELYLASEKRNYLVCGTTNKTENLQGFFVKFGDGGVDIEPVAHLYKSQIFQLSEYFGVIEEIMKRVPSPDTYSYTVSDEEFFFRMPFKELDLLLYAWENKVPRDEIKSVMNVSDEQIERAFRDFSSKFKASAHIRQYPPSMG